MMGQEEKQQQKTANIHDDNFKHNFSDKKVAQAFFKYNLPATVLDELSLETLSMEPTELLPSRYRTRRNADAIYSMQGRKGEKGYALLHVEAQSRHDKSMAMRVWEYQSAIGRSLLRRGFEKIPLILTFVLYSGKAEWTSPKSVAESFANFDLYVNAALRAPFLINLSEAEIDQLKIQGAAAAPQLIMKSRAQGDFCPTLGTLWPLLKKHNQDDEENLNYMMTVDPHADDQFIEKLHKFDPEKANDYKTMFEAALQREHKKALQIGIKEGKLEGIKEGKLEGIKEGEKQGILKGKLEGEKQGMIKIAKQMLAKGMEMLLIAEVTGLSVGELTEMSNGSF